MLTRRELFLLMMSTQLFSSCGLVDPPHPTDLELEKVFYSQQELFEELLNMFEDDSKIARIAFDFTWCKDNPSRPATAIGFTKARWDKYREIFTKLSLKEGIARPINSQRIEMIASLYSILVGGTTKGYAYSKIPLEPLIDSLDSYSLDSRGKTFDKLYKKLTGNWYLFFD